MASEEGDLYVTDDDDMSSVVIISHVGPEGETDENNAPNPNRMDFRPGPVSDAHEKSPHDGSVQEGFIEEQVRQQGHPSPGLPSSSQHSPSGQPPAEECADACAEECAEECAVEWAEKCAEGDKKTPQAPISRDLLPDSSDEERESAENVGDDATRNRSVRDASPVVPRQEQPLRESENVERQQDLTSSPHPPPNRDFVQDPKSSGADEHLEKVGEFCEDVGSPHAQSTKTPPQGPDFVQQPPPYDAGKGTPPRGWTPPQSHPYAHPDAGQPGKGTLPQGWTPTQSHPYAQPDAGQPGKPSPSQGHPYAHPEATSFYGYPPGPPGSVPPSQGYGYYPSQPPPDGSSQEVPGTFPAPHYSFLPGQGPPPGWPGPPSAWPPPPRPPSAWPPPPPYTPSMDPQPTTAQSSPHAQRPYPHRPSPGAQVGGLSPGPDSRIVSSQRVGLSKLQMEELRNQELEEDDVHPEDSVSCVGIPRNETTAEQKVQEWRMDEEGTATDTPGILHVTGLSSSTEEDDVADYFEHRKRGGFQVDRVELDRKSGSALVYFQDPTAVEAILQKGPFEIDKKRVDVKCHVPPMEEESTEEEGSGTILEVSGLPESVDEDDVADFFENRRRGGFTVTKVEIDEETGTALVYFQDPSAMEAVLARAPFILHKASIVVKPFVPEKEIDPRFVLHVTGLPESVDEDDVADFFENRKRGGFEVTRVDLDDKARSALVHFEDASAVEVVIQKSPLQIRKTQIEVKQYVPEKKKDYRLMLLVEGISDSVDDDDMADYFENKKRGGFTVEKVEIFEKMRTAIVYFEVPEAINFLIEKSPWKMSSKQLSVKKCTPGAFKKLLQERELAEDEEEAAQEVAPCHVLKVTELPDSVDEDSLVDFFENRKTSGGSRVDRVELNQAAKSALVYFEDPSAVETVLQKAPFLIGKKKIAVSSCAPDPQARTQVKDSTTEEETCVVAVRGFGEKMSRETLEMYFENTKRSGGQEIQDVRLDEKDGVAYITFKDPEVAKRVASKSDHKLGGSPLRVSLFTPRPCYPDRVFLSGIPTEVSKESLVNYLEAKAKLCPTDILYGEEEGTALVTFDTPFDLPSLERVLAKRPLGGSQLRAGPVAVSDSVLVRGLPDGTSQDTVELYFDNTRKSGGEDVQRVERVEGGAWVVHFAEPEVASRVSGRNHRLSGKDLQVSLYVECLGQGGGDSDPNTFSVPPLLQLSELDPFLLRFLREAPSQREALVKLLADRHAQPQLADVTPPTLTVTCTLTRETRQGKRLAKTWTADVEAAVKEFLGRLKREEVRMTSTVFKEVETESLKRRPPAGKAAFFSDPKSCTLVVVGEPRTVDDAVRSIRVLQEQKEAELQRKRQTVTETLNNLKVHQLKFLKAINFVAELKKKYTGLRVEIDVEAQKVAFTGLFQHVKEAQLAIFQKVQNISSEQRKISRPMETMLQKKRIQTYVGEQLRKRNLVAVWEVADGEITLWAATDQDVVQAAHVVRGAIQERSLKVDPQSLPLLNGPLWQRLKRTAEGQEGLVILTADAARREVTVTGVEEFLAPVLEEVRNFFEENTLYQQRLRFPPGRQRFLTEHLMSEIQELQNRNRAYHVSISTGKRMPEFKLEGTRMGLARVVEGLRTLGGSIRCERRTLNDEGLAEFLNSNRGKDVLTLVQNTGRCVIQHKDDPTDQPTVSGGSIGSSDGGTSEMGVYQLGGGAVLHVTMGDLTTLPVGAIVNAANGDLKHTGGLAKAISDKAGPSLQAECNAYLRQNGSLRDGEVMVSVAGSLPCQKVIHAVGPRYQGGQAGEEDRLKAAVRGSLQAAQSFKLSSIAIPAISSGIFGYPVGESTQVIVEAVVEFFRNNASSSLREVHLCDNSSRTLTHFHNAAARFIAPADSEMRGHDERSGRSQAPSWNGARPRDTHGSSRGPVTSDQAVGLRAITGEMAHQQADVLVNTTSRSLNLSQGAVSKSLLKAGGQELQQEASSRYPQGLPADQLFAVTSGGRLRVKCIFHTSLPDWGSGAERFLRTLIEKSIQEADRGGYSSIAFPALGTGVLSYPRDVVVRCFQEIASSLLPACRSLREIRVVIFPSDQASVKAFRSLMKKGDLDTSAVGSGATAQGTTPPSAAPKRSRADRCFTRKPPKGPAQPKAADGNVHAFHVKDIVLVVKRGNILEEQVDAIVNSSNSSIDLKIGAVAQAILKICGPSIESECQKKANQDEMQAHGVVTTPSPGLACSKIIHVNGYHFRNNWKECIKKCLEKADKENVHTIAFPALGTGNAAIKPEESATAFIEAIKNAQKSSMKTLKEVRVVVFQPQMFASFADTIQKAVEAPEAKKAGWLRRFFNYFVGEMAPSDAITPDEALPRAEHGPITLFMFSDRPTEIRQALDNIMKTYKSAITTQDIPADIIKDLTDEECAMLHNLDQAFKVTVKVDKRRGAVTVEGLSENVMNANNEVHGFLRQAERERQEMKEAEMVSNYVQWCFLDSSGASSRRQDYDKKTSADLEREYKKQSPFAKITDNRGDTYVFDFNDMVEYPEDNPGDKFKIIRRDLLEKGSPQALPDTWDDMSADEDVKLVQLQTNDPEFAAVQTEFLKTIGGYNVTISMIERIQNRTLHNQYMTKKQAMDKQNPPNTQNERKLWHGTAGDAITSIVNYGFNRSYCGKNAVVHGNGVYFAVNSNYSAHPGYSPPDNKGDRRILYVRVLAGEYTLGKSGMRVPPVKQGHVLYDSVVNAVANPIMYVVFNDTQAYPDYLITFR